MNYKIDLKGKKGEGILSLKGYHESNDWTPVHLAVKVKRTGELIEIVDLPENDPKVARFRELFDELRLDPATQYFGLDAKYIQERLPSSEPQGPSTQISTP